MIKNPYSEQNHYSKISKCINKTGHDSFRIMKWLAFYDRSYCENIKYYGLM